RFDHPERGGAADLERRFRRLHVLRDTGFAPEAHQAERRSFVFLLHAEQGLSLLSRDDEGCLHRQWTLEARLELADTRLEPGDTQLERGDVLRGGGLRQDEREQG